MASNVGNCENSHSALFFVFSTTEMCESTALSVNLHTVYCDTLTVVDDGGVIYKLGAVKHAFTCTVPDSDVLTAAACVFAGS